MVDATIQYPLGVGALTTRIIEGGRGHGECVIFVHGVGARADRFRPNVIGLAEAGYRTIAFDLPGHGFATKRGDLPYSVAFFAEFTLGVLDALGIETAALVGTSLGGHIVAGAALLQPHRARRVVMIGSLGLVPTPDLAPTMARSLRERSREAVRAKLLRVCGDETLVTEEWVEEEWRIANSPGAGEALDAISDFIAERQNDETLGPRLARLPASTSLLLVWGENDASVPLEVALRARNTLEGAPLLVLRGTGHGPYYERPSEFNQVLVEFLRGELGSDAIQYR